MELEIIKEKDNSLFKRKEVQAKLKTDITPSKVSVTQLLAEKFSAKPESVSIKGIHGTFGTREFIVTANIYNSKEEKDMEKKKKKKAQPAQEQAENKTEEKK